MASNMCRYPRGYVAIIGGNNVITPDLFDPVDVPFDDLIETMFKMFVGKTANIMSWDYRKVVLTRIAQLFGNFNAWLHIQALNNDHLYGMNYDFIVDTLRFIRTGRRHMSVFTWYDLLLEYPEQKLSASSRVRNRELLITDAGEFKDYISMWVSHPGGFEDLLWTAHVLFGSSKTPHKT